MNNNQNFLMILTIAKVSMTDPTGVSQVLTVALIAALIISGE